MVAQVFQQICNSKTSKTQDWHFKESKCNTISETLRHVAYCILSLWKVVFYEISPPPKKIATFWNGITQKFSVIKSSVIPFWKTYTIPSWSRLFFGAKFSSINIIDLHLWKLSSFKKVIRNNITQEWSIT